MRPRRSGTFYIFFYCLYLYPLVPGCKKGDKVTVRVCVCMCGLIVFSKSERPSYFFYFGINRPVGKHSNGSFDSVETKALKVGGRTHMCKI